MSLTLTEVAKDLRVSERAVRNWIKGGHLKAFKAGIGSTSPIRVTEEALAEFKENQAVKAAS